MCDTLDVLQYKVSHVTWSWVWWAAKRFGRWENVGARGPRPGRTRPARCDPRVGLHVVSGRHFGSSICLSLALVSFFSVCVAQAILLDFRSCTWVPCECGSLHLSSRLASAVRCTRVHALRV